MSRRYQVNYSTLSYKLHNSDCAFQRAANFFNARNGHGVLIIPYGNYLVGEHISGGPYGRSGLTIFPITGCENFEVRGIPQAIGDYPKIKFENCLMYGVFDFATNERLIIGGPFDGNVNWYPNIASPGIFMTIESSSKITIKNLDLDGNTPNISYGGHYADGIQVAFDGIILNSSIDVSLYNLNVHNFGRDGDRKSVV